MATTTKKAVKAEEPEVKAEAVKAEEPAKEKMIHVIFPFQEQAPDTFYYSINGRDFYIDSKAAMTDGVDVPEVLYEVIKNSRKQVIAAAEKKKQLANVETEA